MAYVSVGAQEPLPVRVVPPPAPPPSPYPPRAGFQRKGDDVPVYRWVPPQAFNDPVHSRSRAWGQSRFGPAYRSSASVECPECLQGMGAYYQTQYNWPISGLGQGASQYLKLGALAVGVGSLAYFLLLRKPKRLAANRGYRCNRGRCR